MWCFATGIGLVVLALASPIHAYGEDEFFFVPGCSTSCSSDLAALAIVAGLTGPDPVTGARAAGCVRYAHRRSPIRARRAALWAVNLIVWHLLLLYESALRPRGGARARALPLPHHRRADVGGGRGDAARPRLVRHGGKLGYIVVVRLVETVVANVVPLVQDGVLTSHYDGKEPLGDLAAARPCARQHW